MGVSTDGILFYGYHLPDGTEISEELEETYYSNEPVQIGYHCSGEYPMYYVFVKESHTVASRGEPKPINSLEIKDNWNHLLMKFVTEHKLIQPGQEPTDEYGEYTDEIASNIGWWLTSYWG